MRPLGELGQSCATWGMRAEGIKMQTQSSLSPHAVVFGTVLVLLLSNVSGSMGIDTDVVGPLPTRTLRTRRVGCALYVSADRMVVV